MPCPSISPKWFWTIQIILERPNSFWLGPNNYKNCTRKIYFEAVQNDLGQTKTIWIVQNHFWIIEGQDIIFFCHKQPDLSWTFRIRRYTVDQIYCSMECILCGQENFNYPNLMQPNWWRRSTQKVLKWHTPIFFSFFFPEDKYS